MPRPGKIKLHGFNNLSKTLSFSLYDISYAATAAQERARARQIDANYNAQRLAEILRGVAQTIGANVLNVAGQDYEPHGASAALLISEEGNALGKTLATGASCPASQTVLAHLDKSHVTAHTYPESHAQEGVSIFRADVDVSTCGLVSPLGAIEQLIAVFQPDVVTLDYRVRGFTRDESGGKHFVDQEIRSIRDFFAHDTRERYETADANLPQQNVFHTSMMRRGVDLAGCLFEEDVAQMTAREQRRIAEMVRREMREIFHGRHTSRDSKPS